MYRLGSVTRPTCAQVIDGQSFPFRLQLEPFQRESDRGGACLDSVNQAIQFCRDQFGSGVRLRHSWKEVILSWCPFRPCSASFPLRLQPICSCFSLILLKITCSCLARERTAVSVRFIRIPIALELSPVSANLRNFSSSACVQGREAKCAGSVIARPVWRATRFTSQSFCSAISVRLQNIRGTFENITLILPSLTIRSRAHWKKGRTAPTLLADRFCAA
jgi:hypothetical protein